VKHFHDAFLAAHAPALWALIALLALDSMQVDLAAVDTKRGGDELRLAYESKPTTRKGRRYKTLVRQRLAQHAPYLLDDAALLHRACEYVAYVHQHGRDMEEHLQDGRESREPSNVLRDIRPFDDALGVDDENC
jgi:hypothetical protein